MKLARNKVGIVFNPFQGEHPKGLCVCSAGVLRSPTLAELLVARGWNARSCGSEDFALVPLTKELVIWADEIFCMDARHQQKVLQIIEESFDEEDSRPLVHDLGIPDDFDFRDPELVRLLNLALDERL